MVKIFISNASSDPIYLQIFSQIRDAIIREELKAGEGLPSIRSLARDLGISVITTKRAYDDLEAAGFVSSVGGKGTYVAGGNPAFLKEARLRLIEEKLAEAAAIAATIGVGRDELVSMLDVVSKED
jgi:GntR family transcriptional regulator